MHTVSITLCLTCLQLHLVCPDLQSARHQSRHALRPRQLCHLSLLHTCSEVKRSKLTQDVQFQMTSICYNVMDSISLIYDQGFMYMYNLYTCSCAVYTTDHDKLYVHVHVHYCIIYVWAFFVLHYSLHRTTGPVVSHVLTEFSGSVN